MIEQVLIASELPTDASSLVEEVVRDHSREISIEAKLPEASGEASTGLTFAPVSGTAIRWFLLKITGEAAVALTGAIIGELVHKKLQERKELARKTVRMRFPDGVVYNLVVDDQQSKARLQQMISSKAQR